MGYVSEIGRIHPAFFKLSNLFNRFEKTFDNKGGVQLVSPFFVLNYSLETGLLACDDSDVLDDFVKVIKNSYGSGISREVVKQSIEWENLKDDWSILNVGVCILPDTEAGWDGSPNVIYYDNAVPGTLVNLNFQFWNKHTLFDAYKLGESDIDYLGGRVTIPNLIDAMILHKGDENKRIKIEKLIGYID